MLWSNIFRFTGHLCGEFIDHQWFPNTKASDLKFWCFNFFWINGWVNNGDAGDLRRNRAHYDVTVMVLLINVIIDGLKLLRLVKTVYFCTNCFHFQVLTHWSWDKITRCSWSQVSISSCHSWPQTYICISKLGSIGSGIGLSPVRCQAIINLNQS